MSNGISPLGLVGGAVPATAVAGPVATAASVAATGAAAAVRGPFSPNPSSYIDPALGIVVIEFHAASGKIIQTIPTSQQIAAYRHSLGPLSVPGAGAGLGRASLPAAASVVAAASVPAATPTHPGPAPPPAGTTLTV